MENLVYSADILNPIVGGLFIGASAVVMMLFNGRVAGISGVFFQLTKPLQQPLWQLMFVVGLMGGAFLYYQVSGQSYPVVSVSATGSWGFAVVGGFLVGVGTRLGGGCTSGHGVCGISRFSPRSIVATLVFMSTAILTVSVLGLMR